MDELNTQIEKTLLNLERGEVMMEDRIFLTHVLEEFHHLVEIMEDTSEYVETLVNEMIGTTRELVEDGLT